MTDDLIPEDDAIANRARHALQRLAEPATAELSWTDVTKRARRVQQRRLSALGAACTVVVVIAAVAVVTFGQGDGDNVHVAGGTQPSTSTAAETPTGSASTTTSTPDILNSSSAAPMFPGNSSSAPTTGSAPPLSYPVLPATSPLPGDVTGTLTASVESAPLAVVAIATSVDVETNIRNTSDHDIWASSSLVPTSLATICRSDSADASQSLWWMTNVLLAPGDTDGRGGTFTPTAAYAGTVTCELDIVTTDQLGTEFDTSAGGDSALATFIARVTGVPVVTFSVADTSTTIVDNPVTTVPATTTTIAAP